VKDGRGKPSNLQRTYELIAPHRKRAVLRKCFDRIDRIVSREDATAGEVLQALKALDMVLGLAAPTTPTDKLAEAIMRPDDLSEEEFWPKLEEMIEQRRKYAKTLS
jgi:predicted transcriptional regulator